MKYFIGLLFLLYSAINLIPFLHGLNHAEDWQCETKKAKIEYLFPGFRLGCYLGLPFSEK